MKGQGLAMLNSSKLGTRYLASLKIETCSPKTEEGYVSRHHRALSKSASYLHKLDLYHVCEIRAIKVIKIKIA